MLLECINWNMILISASHIDYNAHARENIYTRNKTKWKELRKEEDRIGSLNSFSTLFLVFFSLLVILFNLTVALLYQRTLFFNVCGFFCLLFFFFFLQHFDSIVSSSITSLCLEHRGKLYFLLLSSCMRLLGLTETKGKKKIFFQA